MYFAGSRNNGSQRTNPARGNAHRGLRGPDVGKAHRCPTPKPYPATKSDNILFLSESPQKFSNFKTSSIVPSLLTLRPGPEELSKTRYSFFDWIDIQFKVPSLRYSQLLVRYSIFSYACLILWRLHPNAAPYFIPRPPWASISSSIQIRIQIFPLRIKFLD